MGWNEITVIAARCGRATRRVKERGPSSSNSCRRPMKDVDVHLRTGGQDVQQVVSRLRRSRVFWAAVIVVVLAVVAVKTALHFWLVPASYADARLKRDAEKVSVPAGLVFTGYSHQSYDTFGLAPDEEADLSYDNPSMSCDQLLAAWLATLAKDHLRVDTKDSTARQIFIHDLGANVAVNLGDIGDCSRPLVSAEDN
jgi:hypothetical protein